jgi:predicted AAA+ superfamily ATPase
MIIIHVVDDPTTLPRHAQRSLNAHLQVMPAVVLTGARQTGKSTLAQRLTTGERRFVSLDDLDVLGLARQDPDALVSGTAPITLDEVQREPNLLLAVKREIDRDRHPGRFLLTGSANLLLMRRVSESLAGRASYLTLWPMTRREQRGLGRCGLWEELISSDERTWMELLRSQDAAEAPREDWRALARRGGFPVPALRLRSAAERAVWFEGYVRTYLERDLLALSTVTALPDFHRLMRAVCMQLGQIANETDLARRLSIPQPTVHRWLNLLEVSYLLVRLPAFALRRTKRLMRRPKLYAGDVGLALHLAGTPEPNGAHLENLVLHDLLCWRDARQAAAEVLYWRTHAGQEVDLLVEADGRLLPIEVKATSRPRLSDTAGLRAFRAEYGEASRAGLLLHSGSLLEWITPDVLAAPWWAVC